MEILALLAMLNAEPNNISKAPERYEVASTCFNSGEETSGMNKICYYDCLGGTKAITISSVKLCPLSIRD